MSPVLPHLSVRDREARQELRQDARGPAAQLQEREGALRGEVAGAAQDALDQRLRQLIRVPS